MIQGANQAATCIGQSLGPLLLSSIFKYTSSSNSTSALIDFPSALFLVAALFALTAAVIAMFVPLPLEEQPDRYIGKLTQPILDTDESDHWVSDEIYP